MQEPKCGGCMHAVVDIHRVYGSNRCISTTQHFCNEFTLRFRSPDDKEIWGHNDKAPAWCPLRRLSRIIQ